MVEQPVIYLLSDVCFFLNFVLYKINSTIDLVIDKYGGIEFNN